MSTNQASMIEQSNSAGLGRFTESIMSANKSSSMINRAKMSLGSSFQPNKELTESHQPIMEAENAAGSLDRQSEQRLQGEKQSLEAKGSMQIDQKLSQKDNLDALIDTAKEDEDNVLK